MDGPLPLPLADPLASAGVPLPGGAAADALEAGRGGARFETLLELAQLSLAAGETGADAPLSTAAEAPVERAADATREVASDPFAGLLFLAGVNLATATAEAPPAPDGTAHPDADAATTPAAADAPAQPQAPAAPVLASAAAVSAAAVSAAAGAPPQRATLLQPLLAAQPAQSAEAPRVSGRETAAAPAGEPQLAAAAESPAIRALHGDSQPMPALMAAPAATEALAFVQPASTAPTSAAAPLAVAIETPVAHPRFAEDTAEKLVTLVTRGIERAELRVSPAELGPVEVRIDVRAGEASLAIVAAQPETRSALEQALPALRELLAQQGLTLGEATVRDGRADAQNADREAPGNGSAAAADDEAGETLSRPMRVATRLIDVFA